MKTMKKFLSMAALAMVGAMTVGCTNEDNVIDQAQTAIKNNVVTQTVTIGFDEQAATRALAIDYTNKKLTKIFAEGDQIAVVYENTSDKLVKETVTIAAGDISTDSKSAKFTVTMTNPKASGTLKYIYPAAMAGATDVDYTKLNTQNGTLESLAANLDLATFEGTLTAAKELPASASLKNKLAILALKIKNSDGTNDLTSSITSMTLSDGTNSYSITGKDADGHIYAAIQTTSGANISCFATTASGNYAKSLTDKTYAANNIYDLGLKMNAATTVSLASVTTDQTIGNGTTLTGTLGSNVKISIADGAIVTLKDANINGDGTLSGNNAGITCEGDATIILEGENNKVQGFASNYPGIYVPENKTLTITGSGSLTVKGGSFAAGIGTGRAYNASVAGGNIEINGGTIIATGGSSSAAIGTGYVNTDGSSSSNTCGTITINGGSVTATGGNAAAGIGTGSANNSGSNECGAITINGGTVIAIGKTGGAGIGTGSASNSGSNECGAITISTGVTSVTATKGNSSPNIIGKGYAQGGGTQNCGTITFGATQVFDGSAWSTDPMAAGTYGGLTLAITNSNKTWTLTPAP